MRRIDPRLTQNARGLHNNPTRAERLLWLRLRQFRPRLTRQFVIEPYIVDLACREAKLAIELDGGQHAERTADYDRRRTEFLQDLGWMVLRLWNNEVEQNPDGSAVFVLNHIAGRLGSTHPQPLPFQGGEAEEAQITRLTRRQVHAAKGSIADVSKWGAATPLPASF